MSYKKILRRTIEDIGRQLDFRSRDVHKGKIRYNSKVYLPSGNTPYDGRLDGHFVMINPLFHDTGEWDDSVIGVPELKEIFLRKEKGEEVFPYEEIDKVNGVSLWYWWFKEEN